ncbi:ribonuclease H-like domain-containing protein, partial [Tanacetum coccineum]
MGENIPSEGTVPSSSGLKTQDLPEIGSQVQPTVRRSSRPSKMPPKFNDYVVGSNVKYGLEKYVSYDNLNTSNYCLSTTLNKSSELSTYFESKFVYSLFTKNSGDVFVALLMYVDDIVIIGNKLSEIEKFKVFLKSKFQIKYLGKLKYFLGIEVLDNAD